jgi:hypothetical protein
MEMTQQVFEEAEALVKPSIDKAVEIIRQQASGLITNQDAVKQVWTAMFEAMNLLARYEEPVRFNPGE